MDYERAEKALARSAERLMGFPNVTSVGIGYRKRGGEETEELCISVGVERKLSPSELPAGGLLPSAVEGVPVDVVETGRLEAL